MAYLGRKRSRKNIDADGYRPNVGIIVANPVGQVLWARRVAHDGWQFPQGGVEHKESPREAAYRELYEEVGLYPHHVRLLGNTQDWYHYDVPRRSEMSGGFKGQKQQWYLFQLTGKDEDIQLDRAKRPEFDNWQWVDYWKPVDEIISFKRDVYKGALAELEPVLLEACSLESGKL